MNPSLALKDRRFNAEKIHYLADLFKKAHPQFQADIFVRQVLNSLPKLELKERIFHIRDTLTNHLPDDFTIALKIILKALPDELDPTKTDDDFGDFIIAPLSYFVAYHGKQEKHLQISLNALAEITKRFSCEDAIRYFINQYPKQSFNFLKEMAKSSSYHQRRLASESLRPKLPWCLKLDFDYQKSIQILDILYFDNTRYVVRSVANHLNDIAKIDENLVIKTLKKWYQQNKQANNKEWDFLIKHALRTLVKQGNQPALNLLGFTQQPCFKINNFKLKVKNLILGEYLEFSFNLHAQQAQKLIIDYQINYPNPNRKQSKKVFKIKQLTIKNQQIIHLKKRHLFKKMSTKKLYSGTYQITLQINGGLQNKHTFNLQVD
jgi:3-methyladenine DNA glycosylase AlkC